MHVVMFGKDFQPLQSSVWKDGDDSLVGMEVNSKRGVRQVDVRPLSVVHPRNF